MKPRNDRVTPLVTVDIHNAQELAARESWAARRFGSLMPRYVGREVAFRVAGQMAEQLAEQGVRAEVRVETERPVEQASATDRPATDRPATDRSATDLPATDRSATDLPASIRDVHLTISAIPFDLLDGVPPARAVRRVHDRVATGVYDTVSAVQRIATLVGRR